LGRAARIFAVAGGATAGEWLLGKQRLRGQEKEHNDASHRIEYGKHITSPAKRATLKREWVADHSEVDGRDADLRPERVRLHLVRDEILSVA
jgi:hypothetical protein